MATVAPTGPHTQVGGSVPTDGMPLMHAGEQLRYDKPPL